MAKTRKASKKEKKRISSRDLIIGCVAIIAVLLVLVLLVWLIMPLAGQKRVPRKFRGLQQSWVEPPGLVCNLRCEWKDEVPKFGRQFRQATLAEACPLPLQTRLAVNPDTKRPHPQKETASISG